MNMLEKRVRQSLAHLYISPLSGCNLNCAMCYTGKTSQRLSAAQIRDFISRYQTAVDLQGVQLQSVMLCGGEVFLLDYLPKLTDWLTDQGLLVQIVTNGTMSERLAEFAQPNSVNLIVSVDGLCEFHDFNRGPGSWQLALDFMKQAHQLGFHLSVFSIITQGNIDHRLEFEEQLVQELGFLPGVTYHPRKPQAYLETHPVDHRLGQTRGFEFLQPEQLRRLYLEQDGSKSQLFPPYELGCYQISLNADGQIYGCCEGITPLGDLDTPLAELIKEYGSRIKMVGQVGEFGCAGCSESNFICGLDPSDYKLQSLAKTDSSWQLSGLLWREQVISLTREYFSQDFQEITTPALNHSLPLEPNLFSFKTEWTDFDKQRELYLPCSPEAALKKVMALGVGDCFSISPAFRNSEPADLEHNPEFLMLEWYRINSSSDQIKKDLQAWIVWLKSELDRSLGVTPALELEYQGQVIDLSGDWQQLSLAELFLQETGKSFKQVDDLEQLKRVANGLGCDTQQATWEQLFNQIFINLIEPKLGLQPVFLIEFPAKLSVLCNTLANQPLIADRFEFYLAGIEVANGNSELTDAKGVWQSFALELESRKERKLDFHPPDQQFVQALTKLSDHKVAGIGVGIERLAMILGNRTGLSQINPFTL